VTNVTDIFGEATPSAEADFLAEYVGEGKKFKDVNELAKAYANADKFIPELKNDLQTTREFIATKLEEIAERNKVEPIGQTVEPREPNPSPAAPPNATEADLETRIAKALEERDEVSRLRANAKIAEDGLILHFGEQDKAVEAVRQKALEMGVEPNFLKEMAYKSPKAFFNLMGVNPEEAPRSNSTPNPSADVNPRVLGLGQPKPNSYEYFDQLRKSDPKLYWSPRTQAEMHRAAQENPDFFKR
jgi:hypothetical protein